MLTATAKTVQHVYVLKFFQGVAEGSTFVGAVSPTWAGAVRSWEFS